jgi:hypothetical protein
VSRAGGERVTARAHDIERAITHALSRRGISGTVVVRETYAELHSIATAVVAIEIDWVDQWDLLPPDIQSRHADRAATRLMRAQDDLRGKRRVVGGRSLGQIVKAALVLGVVVGGLAGAGWWLWESGFFGKNLRAGGGSAPTVDTPVRGAFADRALQALACEAGRKSLYAGAEMGVDVGGWVVELWLARHEGTPRLVEDPAVAEVLAQVGGASGGAALARSEPRTLLGLDSAIVRLEREWVTAFFHPESRKQVEDFAERTAGAAGADYAALYARCAHLTAHDVGAWYRGRDESGATVAVLYAAGAFAEPPAFAREPLEVPAGLIPALAQRVKKLDGNLDERLKPFGGRVDRSGGTVSFRFAFGGPTRAQHLSRELAKTLGL